MPEPRPIPRTTTDAFLALVLDELQGLRADLAGARGGDVEQTMSGRVDMSEPEPTPTSPAKKTAARRRTKET